MNGAIDLSAPMLPQPAVQRIATNARDVLLDNRHRSLIRSLPRVGDALTDDRTVTLTDIPRTGGAPDYRHAKLRFSRTIAVPPAAYGK